MAQVVLLLSSTLLVGIAGAYELTARNKYCSILVGPRQLGSYLTSFSVVFNVGKLVGPPIGGWLLAATGPAWALGIDAASYLLPIASVMFLLQPDRSREVRSTNGNNAGLMSAWRECGPTLQGVLTLTAVMCLVGFFHPGLAPLIAFDVLGGKPTDLGLFTSVLAAGSIAGGLVLQRNSAKFSHRPFLTLGGIRNDYSHCPTGHVQKPRGGVQPGHGLSDRCRHRRPLEQLQPDHSNRLRSSDQGTNGRSESNRFSRRGRAQWPLSGWSRSGEQSFNSLCPMRRNQPCGGDSLDRDQRPENP